MKVACDDVTTIFVDGEQKTVAGTGYYGHLATLQIPASTGAVGIKCHNTGGASGIMAQVQDLAGNVITVTDSSWKCTNQLQDGWSTAGFSEGDNWKPARLLNGVTMYLTTQRFAWNRGLSPKRKVIWTENAYNKVVYCRKVLPRTQAGRLLSQYPNITS